MADGLSAEAATVSSKSSLANGHTSGFVESRDPTGLSCLYYFLPHPQKGRELRICILQIHQDTTTT